MKDTARFFETSVIIYQPRRFREPEISHLYRYLHSQGGWEHEFQFIIPAS